MDGPGTVTWEEFLEDAETFLDTSNRISDGWELRGDKNEPGKAYLVKRRKHFFQADHSLFRNNDADEHHLNFTLTNDPFEASSTIEKPFVTEHHVLWSMSYGVPVLYFHGWKSDFPGINPVTVQEAQSLVRGADLNYMELSQAIHPILATPFLHLHPCKSQELLQFTSKSKNKLVSWLSSIAPSALFLKVQPDYFRLTV
nr:ubiquitin-like-conjugating enzyme ATG10 [Nomia melanderi]XP_031848822.1 ubiquitin-like-conjugating enzyme ATG10 [Nomia melanderi]XP_031848823.1 ubiquitin-like-conjugating enzyme ATG10 [Nomia melanderi]XP_031848824.1 ubiquitin-like-conjugating enzyme ATG10 [Nomia melanderi]XP_031848825.1 ubiquitin-like-conjugating enzyme ATG10 [Nomia melanderi]XP_031848826.1 ubiquitin-like-conjugating enzyme ATG10 [Nomia melanderi]XP_031848827.1 ubiquitin-like-conjugating enzyme ATG10 [Nomia melanderi]